MIPVAEIVTRLKADDDITSIVGELVAPYDIRRDKNPDYFTATGKIRLCLAIDDIGELPTADTHSAMAQDVFYVWFFGPDTTDGRESVAELVPLVIASLSGWQATTRQMMRYTRQRLGVQGGPIIESSMDRLIFTCNGVHAGVDA